MAPLPIGKGVFCCWRSSTPKCNPKQLQLSAFLSARCDPCGLFFTTPNESFRQCARRFSQSFTKPSASKYVSVPSMSLFFRRLFWMLVKGLNRSAFMFENHLLSTFEVINCTAMEKAKTGTKKPVQMFFLLDDCSELICKSLIVRFLYGIQVVSEGIYPLCFINKSIRAKYLLTCY